MNFDSTFTVGDVLQNEETTEKFERLENSLAPYATLTKSELIRACLEFENKLAAAQSVIARMYTLQDTASVTAKPSVTPAEKPSVTAKPKKTSPETGGVSWTKAVTLRFLKGIEKHSSELKGSGIHAPIWSIVWYNKRTGGVSDKQAGLVVKLVNSKLDFYKDVVGKVLGGQIW